MYTRKQFAALEAMSREQAAVAKTEMEHSLMEYWLAEAEEWKPLRQSIHSKAEFRIAQVPSKIQQRKNRMTRDERRLLEHQGSARCEQLGGFHRAKEKFNGVGAGVAYLI